MAWLGTHRAILAVLKTLKDAINTHIDNIETELGITVQGVTNWYAARRGAPNVGLVQLEVYENGTAEILNENTADKLTWINGSAASLQTRVPWECAIRHRNTTTSTLTETVRRSRVYAAAALRALRSKVAFADADSSVRWIMPTEFEVLTEDEFTDDQSRVQVDVVKIRGYVDLDEINDVEGTALSGDDAWITSATLEA